MKTFVIKTHFMGIDHGYGNGYVVIPPGHPVHGLHYDEIDVECNGGLTFSGSVRELITQWPHGGALTESDIDGWVVGFDTGHYQDDMKKWPDEASVLAECDKIVAQLQAMY